MRFSDENAPRRRQRAQVNPKIAKMRVSAEFVAVSSSFVHIRLKFGVYTNLGFTALIAAIVFSLLSLFRLPLTSFLSMLCYVYALWRMLSRNVAKRQEENRQFMDKTGHAQTEIRQFFLRLRGIKTYKYFRCPQCKTRLRLKRGCGEKHVTCPKCQHKFDERA